MPSVLSKRTFLGRWLKRSQSQPAPTMSHEDINMAPQETKTDPATRTRKHGILVVPRTQANVDMTVDDMNAEDILEDEDCPTPLQPIHLGRKLSRSNSLRKKKKKLEEFFARRSRSLSSSVTSDSVSPRPRFLSTSSNPEGLWRRLSESSAFSAGSLSDVETSPCTGKNWSNVSVWSNGSAIRDYARSLSKDEYLYAMVLQAIVNPLGAPDLNPGLRPQDLAQHLRQVFDVDGANHDKWMKEVQHSRPNHVVLNVTVVEARNLRPMDPNGLSDPYCMLCVGSSKNKTPKGTPIGSPKNSPSQGRRRKSSEPREVKRTQIVKATLNPTWNESFEIEVQDFHTEDLEVYVWDSDEVTGPSIEGARHSDRPSGIRSLIRHFKSSVDYGRQIDDFIGQFRVPLKDIPAKGLDGWFDLYEDKKQRIKTSGQCRLKLELSIKQFTQLECVESDQCSIEDFYRITKQLYRHASKEQASRLQQTQTTQSQTKHSHKHRKFNKLKKQKSQDIPDENQNRLQSELSQDKSSPDEESDSVGNTADHNASSSDNPRPTPVLQNLPVKSRTVLDQFGVQQHFSKMTQILLELVVLLELSVESESGCLISEKLLKGVIQSLDNEWISANRGYPGDDLFSERALILTDMELSLFDRAATAYTHKVVNSLRDIPTLFPPHELQLEELNNKVSLLVNLLNLYIWTQNGSQKKDLSILLVQKLQTDIRNWVSMRLEQIHSDAKEPVIPETKMMLSILREAITVITPIYSMTQYFSRVDIDYFKVASLTMESRLANKSQELMLRMDKYQVRYQKYRVNIRESSAVSLQLYFALRNLFNMVRDNISERDLFRLTVSNYQTWFETAVIFWLQTFREEGIRRMEKALEIDKDVVQVTSLVKYSNSSVDVLSCFSKMTTEWRQIDFCDADIGLLGVTKITDTICDGARQYAEKIQTILENNCYYDLDDNNQFDITDTLCITLNNLEHVRIYLHELPQLLNFSPVTQNMSIKHENEQIGQQTNETLLRLVRSADNDMRMRGQQLLKIITDKMAVDLRKYTEKFTRSNSEKKSNVDPLLHYLETNIQVLYERLECTIFPDILGQIWMATLQCFSDTLLSGRPVVYYEQMLSHLASLRAYFHRGCSDGTAMQNTLYDVIVQRLKLNTHHSDELMLQYLYSLTDTTTPMEYLGMLAVRMGYMKETGGLATIYVTVEGGTSLPGVSRRGLCDPYVTVTLLPPKLFPKAEARTKTLNNTVTPKFNETFQFTAIPEEALVEQGAVIILTVWNHERFLPDDVLGEIIMHICDIPDMTTNRTIEDMQTVMLPLKYYPEPSQGPYQVLKERSDWDRRARTFLSQRRVMAGYESSVPLCTPVKKVLRKVFGKKPPTVNVYGSAPIL